MKFHKVPGVSITVFEKGHILWAAGYGTKESGRSEPITVDTLFQAASISKPVAAAGMLRLVDEKKLTFDEPVNNKLISWKLPDNDFTAKRPVTLRHLLSHTGGISVHGFLGYANGQSVPTLADVLNGKKPANSSAIFANGAGGTFRYSGGGYVICQQLLCDVTESRFDDFMQTSVLDPLGMKSSTYKQPLPAELSSKAAVGHDSSGKPIAGKWHTYPEQSAAGLWTTPTDLARFAMALFDVHSGRKTGILSKQTVTDMMSPQSSVTGLGVMLMGKKGTRSFNHSGANAGFRCIMFCFLESGQGAVIMTNSDKGDQLFGELFQAIGEVHHWPRETKRPSK